MGIRKHSTLKVVAVMAVMALVAAACGSSEPGGADPTDATTPGVTNAGTPGSEGTTATGDDPSDAPGQSPDAAGGEVEIVAVSLPDGLRPWWESTNRSARFGGYVFLLAASSDVAIGDPQPNLQVLRLDADLEWTPVGVSIPAAATSADMFMTGSRLAVSYLDPAGEVVVLTSVDGTDFAEARLPVPERHVAADTWEATSLIGRIAGAADLGGEVFVIVNTGINWPRAIEIAEDYAIEQAPDTETADNIRSSGTIRSQTLDDGDVLYAFVKNDEVVAEVLGSDAGIEPGYTDAYKNRGGGSFESQSWMIDGKTSRNLDTPPFGGREGLRFHALYPVDGGAAAMVTDFNIAAAPAEAFGAPGIYAAAAPVAFAQESAWDLFANTTFDGKTWLPTEYLGVPLSSFQSLAWAIYLQTALYVCLFFDGGFLGFAVSQDGSSWGTGSTPNALGARSSSQYGAPADSNAFADLRLTTSVEAQAGDASFGAGGSLQILVTSETTFHVYSPDDAQSREYRVEYDSSGNATIEQISESEVPELGANQVAVSRFGGVLGDILFASR